MPRFGPGAWTLAALLTAAPVLTLWPQSPPPTPVRSARAERRELQEHDRVIGTLRAMHRAEIAALEAGPLIEVRVKEGALVAKGDVLARTDTRRLDAQLGESRAELEKARADEVERAAELEYAVRDRESMESAAEKNAVSQRRLREAQTAERVARARRSAAEQTVHAIEKRIEYLEVRRSDAEIRAPFDARVVARHAEPGEWIEPGAPVATLVSTGAIEAWLEVPERLAGSVARHADEVLVQIRAVDGSRRSIQTRVVPEVHPRARTFSFIADIPNDDEALSPGMSVTAWLPVGRKVAYLTVPKDALVRRGDRNSVYRVVEQDGVAVAEEHAVEVLFESGDFAAIADSAGITPDDTVVVEGNERLLPGTPVAVVSPGRGDADDSDDDRDTAALLPQPPPARGIRDQRS